MKMSDYFNLPLIIKRGDYLQDSKGLLISRDAEECGPYIAKAVNNHDKLVEAIVEILSTDDQHQLRENILGHELYDKVIGLLKGIDQ